MGHHSGDAVELSHRLVEVLDVLCHGRRGDGFPRFLDDEGLAAFLDAHLLKEHVHDDEHDDGKQHGVVLDLVDLEDDELLVKEAGINVVVQRVLELTALIELL